MSAPRPPEMVAGQGGCGSVGTSPRARSTPRRRRRWQRIGQEHHRPRDRRGAPAHHVSSIEHDAYYIDLSHLPFEERARVNFDHPDSLDNELFIRHLDALRAGRAVEKPRYDFARTPAAATTALPRRPSSWSRASWCWPSPRSAPPRREALRRHRRRHPLDAPHPSRHRAARALLRQIGGSSTTRRCGRCTWPSSSRPSASPT
jgi:hypothetical protein